MKNCFLFLLLLSTQQLSAQTDSIGPGLTFSAYVEGYYSYDFGQPKDHIRQPFFYSYNRHNTFSVNLALAKVAYDNGRVRGNVALMAGTYANDNLATEPGVLKNIYEANGGVRISGKKAVWVDAGVMPSHIGWESAIGKDNPNLTHSIAAENSPYYETGVRLSYTSDNGKWYAAGLVLNGWQRIERIDGNQTPAFGHQLAYRPNAKLTLNSSSFIGNTYPDSVRKMRYFHDLYALYSVSPKVSVIAGFDVGAEQVSKGSSDYNIWYSPVLTVAAKVSPHWTVAARGEYYSDGGGVLIPTGTPNGFKTIGYSLNMDRAITTHALWRIEARGLHSEDAIFPKDGLPVQDNVFVTTMLAVAF